MGLGGYQEGGTVITFQGFVFIFSPFNFLEFNQIPGPWGKSMLLPDMPTF